MESSSASSSTEEATADTGPSSLGIAAQFDEVGDATIYLFAPTVMSKDQCRNGGWEDFAVFSDQGESQGQVSGSSSVVPST